MQQAATAAATQLNAQMNECLKRMGTAAEWVLALRRDANLLAFSPAAAADKSQVSVCVLESSP